MHKRFFLLVASFFLAGLTLCSCSGRLGWGVLLWSTDKPAIPSGTVLPVYIRSNIDHVYVVGIPRQYQAVPSKGAKAVDKMEVPLARIALESSKGKARKYAAAFKPYALLYAETLQDGLPIRKEADNGATRVYKLKLGEVIKILQKVEGSPPISTTGAALPGEWYQVLTASGVTGYCFSYRLRTFPFKGGSLNLKEEAQASGGKAAGARDNGQDAVLDTVLAAAWYPESYGTMADSGNFDLDAMKQHWGFFPGSDSGLARVFTVDSDGSVIDKTFSYKSITSVDMPGSSFRTWTFDGSSLQMTLRGEGTLAVQYNDEQRGGALKSLIFVTLGAKLDDLILQEEGRREALFQALAAGGPVYTSTNYGVFTLLPAVASAAQAGAAAQTVTSGAASGAAANKFTWSGYSLLIPAIIPASSLGSGTILMDKYLDPSLQNRFTGAFSLRFDSIGGQQGGQNKEITFLYTLDSQGLRLEYVGDENIEGNLVTKRSRSPVVIFFTGSNPGGNS
jgi:hypothetical protein